MFLPSVGLLGLLGNIGAIFILLRPEMKSTFHHTLIALAAVDILFIVILIVDSRNFDMDLNNQAFIILFPYVWNPLKNILMTFETFLMMSITTERYLAIRRPLEYRLGRVRYSSSMHLATYILPALLLSIILNIPKFFETELVTRKVRDEVLYDYNITALRLHPDYILYYTHWTRLLATGIIPLLYLLMGNALIAQTLRRNNTSRNTGSPRGAAPGGARAAPEAQGRLRIHSNSKHTDNSQSQSLLMAIVLVYLVCNTPRLVINMAEYFLQEDIGDSIKRCAKEPDWLR